MTPGVNLIAALMALNVSSSWGQDLMPMEKVQTDQVRAGHANHSVQAEQEWHEIKSGPKAKLAPAKASGEIELMQHMDHSKMTHDSMSGSNHGGIDHSGMHHDATPAKEQGGGESMSVDSAPPDARDPYAYSDGYDFGPIPRSKMGDEDNFGALWVDRLESVSTRNNTAMTYDWQAWYGQTYDRALIRAEGEIEDGKFKDARNELLWAHAITAYWDSQLGIRYDSGKGTDRGWLAFGVQGLAPYWLYVEATAYVSEQGRTAFRLETEYDLLLTQKLILQPRVEMNFYSQRDDSRDVSSGLSNLEAGLRLRYEFRREFAPYVGVEWASRFGSAADNMRASGKDAGEARLVAGVRFWL
jgi:copper resistance protein B